MWKLESEKDHNFQHVDIDLIVHNIRSHEDNFTAAMDDAEQEV